jgi:nucleoid-associated protein YgaU
VPEVPEPVPEVPEPVPEVPEPVPEVPEPVPEVPEPVPATERTAPPPSLLRRERGLLLVLVGAALLGLVVGIGVVLRGRSLGSGAPGASASRPTFVIGTPVSPGPVLSPSPSAVVARPAASTEYVVQPGDTLRSIAQEVYGNTDEWPRIYDANRDLIGPDPDSLQAGMRLRIP